MKPRLGIILVLALTLALLPALHAQPQGCAVATENGMMPDSDCDGVPDAFDNCPYVANADQLDMNRNGVGDACDLVINEIIVNPDNHLRQGDFAHITIRVLNNRDGALQDITLNVRNKDLGIDAVANIPYVPVGETGQSDFWLKIPKCAKTQNYPLSIAASFKEPTNGVVANEVQTETISVDNGTCGTANGPLDNTVITVFNKLEVDDGGSVLLPISITNLGDSQATYDLSLQDMGNLGTWRIDPAARMKLASGVRSNANLYLQIEHVGAGTRTLQLTVTSDNQKTVIPIELYVRNTVNTSVPFAFIAFQLIFIVVLVLLIITAILIAIRHNKKKNSGNDTNGHHKVEPYYDDGSASLKADVKKTETKTEKKEITTKSETSKSKRKTVSVEKVGDGKMETYY